MTPAEAIDSIVEALGVDRTSSTQGLAAAEAFGLVEFDRERWRRVEEPRPKQPQANGWDSYRTNGTRLWL